MRPTALAYALAVVIAWLACLTIATGRVELLFVAVPLALRLLQAPVATRPFIHQFELAAKMSVPHEGEELRLTIQARTAPASGVVEILPVLPAQLSAAHRATVLLPGPDGSVLWDPTLLCRYGGILDLGAVFFRLWDRSGLWVGECRGDHPVSLTVRPQALAVRAVPAPAATQAPFGGHRSRQLGDGSDFADIRAFAAGDRMRRINWPVSLRLRALHVNEFHVERSADVILLLDSFTSVGQRPYSSLDHCLRAAAGLARTYLRQHDRVGLMEIGGWVRWTKPAAGPQQYINILQALSRITIAASEFPQSHAARPEAMLPRHALIVALTPLADARFGKIITRLADQGRDVVLLAVRGDELSLAFLPRRAADPLVRGLWRLLREERLRELRSHGVRAVDWSPSQPIDAALAAVRLPVGRGAAWYA